MSEYSLRDLGWIGFAVIGYGHEFYIRCGFQPSESCSVRFLNSEYAFATRLHTHIRYNLRSKRKTDGRHITIREVAKAAGASVATISAALNNSDYVSAEMRGRIQDAIKQLKYRPNDLARGLRLQKTHSIAIIVPDLSNNFYVDVV